MNNNSGVNTILLVVVLVVIVGFGVWYFQSKEAPEEDAGFNLNIDMPSDNEENQEQQ